MNKKRWIIVGCTICTILLLLGYCYRGEIKARFQARDLLIAVEQGCGSQIKIKWVNLDEGKKYFQCIFKVGSYGSNETKKEMDDFNNVRKIVNKYFDKHSEYFLNDGYEIELQFKSGSQAEWCAFSNKRFPTNDKITSHNLTNARIQMYCNISDLASYSDLGSLRLEGSVIEDNISTLKNFSKLKHIYDYPEFEQKEIKEIKEWLPNCEIDN